MGNYTIFEYAKFGYFDVVKKYLEDGNDVNAKSKYGYSLMYEANSGGRTEVQHLLLDYDFDVHMMEGDGRYTFCKIVQDNRYELIERMLKMGADPNCLLYGGPYTIIQYTVNMYNPYSSKMLAEYGGKLDFEREDKTSFEHMYDCYKNFKSGNEEWLNLLCKLTKEKKNYNEFEQKMYEEIKLQALFS
jgi:ankyrin repeat protein